MGLSPIMFVIHTVIISTMLNFNGLFPLPDSDSDSDTDSHTMQILWEMDPNLNLSQWKHVLHNAM